MQPCYSPKVKQKLRRVDHMLQRLLDGLEERELLPCVNLIVLADHGMASSAGIPHNNIKLTDYIPNIYDVAYTYNGAFPRIDSKNKSEGEEKVLYCVGRGGDGNACVLGILSYSACTDN